MPCSRFGEKRLDLASSALHRSWITSLSDLHRQLREATHGSAVGPGDIRVIRIVQIADRRYPPFVARSWGRGNLAPSDCGLGAATFCGMDTPPAGKTLSRWREVAIVTSIIWA